MENGRQRSWMSRNWGWLLGGGCLSIIVIGVFVIGGIIYKVSDSITGSEPYTYAFTKASENEDVIRLLGTPIESDGMGSTSFSIKNGEKEANLMIPIKGPDNSGVIIVKGYEVDDVWSYEKLEAVINDTNAPINLLDEKTEEQLDEL